jgi:transposase-like protein
MSGRSFNLLPADVASRVESRRASRGLALVAVAATGLAGLVAAAGHWIDARSSATLAEAEASGAPVLAVEAEIREIESARTRIAEALDLQRAVGVPVPATGMIRAVSEALPEGATLERIALEYANVQGELRRNRRPAREDADPRELRAEIAGFAQDEADVGRLVDRLSALAPVARVSLESSRSREMLGRSVREFRIGFTVDLERRWRLPALVVHGNVAATEDEP